MGDNKFAPPITAEEAKRNISAIEGSKDAVPLPSASTPSKEYSKLHIAGPQEVIDDFIKAAKAERYSYWEYLDILMQKAGIRSK
ncbi:hypothetical protein [Alterisphingorhabdus coralli]|uniref:Uncharacterized protein n=1 Tax=Alterisphingorhabdus coralli TaxID=3071408 RepID=A0AA97FCV7_9SPHN|nr:hypothetical protein [Parasphingorhabdus sp. SCSIO 66989]WOE76735.1 hypothetical protein RB602_15225 [Parasphingorhabdus sp. SCSIO 66989]